MSKQLDRSELEARRIEVGLRRRGICAAEVAVSRTSVMRWQRALAADGRRFYAAQTGRPPLLSANDQNSLFAGSDAGARRWAIANTLIQTCKLNSIDPLAWLTDVLQRIVSGQPKNQGLHALLPWNWHSPSTAVTA